MTEVASRYLEGRTRAVASILVRAGMLLNELQRDPALCETVGLRPDYLDHPRLSWRFLQDTVRRGITAEQFGRAAAKWLYDGVRGKALSNGHEQATPSGVRPFTFLASYRDFDGTVPAPRPPAPPRLDGTKSVTPERAAGDASRMVAEWLRWIDLQCQEMTKLLETRRGVGRAAYAAAAGGASIGRLSQLAAIRSPTPPDVQRAFELLDDLRTALQPVRRKALGSPARPDASPAHTTTASADLDAIDLSGKKA